MDRWGGNHFHQALSVGGGRGNGKRFGRRPNDAQTNRAQTGWEQTNLFDLYKRSNLGRWSTKFCVFCRTSTNAVYRARLWLVYCVFNAVVVRDGLCPMPSRKCLLSTFLDHHPGTVVVRVVLCSVCPASSSLGCKGKGGDDFGIAHMIMPSGNAERSYSPRIAR